MGGEVGNGLEAVTLELIEDVHGDLPGGAEVGAVIEEKVQAGFQGLNV